MTETALHLKVAGQKIQTLQNLTFSFFLACIFYFI